MGDPAKPLRVALIGQMGMTIFLAVLSAWVAGLQGALSALLGGAVAMSGGLVFMLLAPPKKVPMQTADMAWNGLSRMLKAEGAKVAVIVILLWLVLANYKEVVMLGFIGTFIVAVIIFSMAIFFRNPSLLEMPEAGKNNVN
jgi:ATP synthase protein I